MNTPEFDRKLDRLEHHMNGLPRHPDPKIRAAAALLAADKLVMFLVGIHLARQIRVGLVVWALLGFSVGVFCGWWWLA